MCGMGKTLPRILPKLRQSKDYAGTVRATRPSSGRGREEAITSADRTPEPKDRSDRRSRGLLESGADIAERIELARQAREMGKRLRELYPPRIRDFPRFPGE